jgi:ribosome assembly protein 1
MAQQLRLVPPGNDESIQGVAGTAPMLQSIESGIVAGFQMAAASGPLCGDPLWGVAFKLEVALATDDADAFDISSLQSWKSLDFRESLFGPLSGQVCRGVTEAS